MILPRLAKRAKNAVFSIGSPEGNRTPDSAVRGRRLDRLTTGPYSQFASI